MSTKPRWLGGKLKLPKSSREQWWSSPYSVLCKCTYSPKSKNQFWQFKLPPSIFLYLLVWNQCPRMERGTGKPNPRTNVRNSRSVSSQTLYDYTNWHFPAPASFAIIFLSLFIAFSETLRDIVSKMHKIGAGLSKDFILHPIKSFLWGSATGKIPIHVVPEDSGLRKRFDEYLGYGRRNMQRDEDIWRRWQGDRISAGKGNKKGKYEINSGFDRRRPGEV